MISRLAFTARRLAAPSLGAARMLNVHEDVSMYIMKAHGIQTPECYVADNADDAEDIFLHSLNKANRPLNPVVIKAQVLSGGRGLGTFKNGFKGGVHVVHKPNQAKEFAANMLGQELVTKQAKNGILCNKVLLVERINVKREMYFSIILDRKTQGPMMIASPHGGTSIEALAKSNPELIFSEPIDIMEGITTEQCHRMASNLGMQPESAVHGETVRFIQNLWKLFVKSDCTQAEVNPLVETADGDLVVCDAKLNFDDNAKRRQPEIFARRDTTQEDPREVDAQQYNLKYIGLEGSIGCMVNGGGLAMATMDIIKHKGAEPANFLDVGGAATEEQISKAFEILNADSHVQVILVNIFGGIMRCDMVAVGIIKAAKVIGLEKPVVIRLQGTNEDKGKALIQNSGYQMIMAHTFDDAAEKAVRVAEMVKDKSSFSEKMLASI